MLVVLLLIMAVRDIKNAHVVEAVKLVYHRNVKGAICGAETDKTSRERELCVPLRVGAETEVRLISSVQRHPHRQ